MFWPTGPFYSSYPIYLILCAAGAVWMFRRIPPLRLASIGTCVIVFAFSVPYAAQKPGTPNDYQGIAQAILPKMRPDDLVFMRQARDWTLIHLCSITSTTLILLYRSMRPPCVLIQVPVSGWSLGRAKEPQQYPMRGAQHFEAIGKH